MKRKYKKKNVFDHVTLIKVKFLLGKKILICLISREIFKGDDLAAMAAVWKLWEKTISIPFSRDT